MHEGIAANSRHRTRPQTGPIGRIYSHPQWQRNYPCMVI